jgi:hypothetical protein
MLLRKTDAPNIALDILSGLKRTQMFLLSCATIVTGQDSFALEKCSKSKNWSQEKEGFALHFSCFVLRSWTKGEILGNGRSLLTFVNEIYNTYECGAPKGPSTKRVCPCRGQPF